MYEGIEVDSEDAVWLKQQRDLMTAIRAVDTFSAGVTKKTSKIKRLLNDRYDFVDRLLSRDRDSPEQQELIDSEDAIEPSKEIIALLCNPTEGII